VTTQYLVDDLNPTGYAQVVEELVNGAVTRQYTYGLQRISEEQPINGPWTPSFYGYDGGGSVRQLTNASATVTDTYNYDAFGNLLNSTGTTPNSYLYRGEQYDSDLGLYYLRARYYNPFTGRFMSRDPEGGRPFYPKSLHKYIYASGDPVNRVDPRGRTDLVEFIGTVKASMQEAKVYLNVIGCGIAIGSSITTSILTQSLNIDPGSAFSTAFGCLTAKMNPTGVVNVGFTAVGLEACVGSLEQTVADETAYNNNQTDANAEKLAGDWVGSIGGCATTALATAIDLFAP
jgi:RHS repeat-associated protein